MHIDFIQGTSANDSKVVPRFIRNLFAIIKQEKKQVSWFISMDAAVVMHRITHKSKEKFVNDLTTVKLARFCANQNEYYNKYAVTQFDDNESMLE